MQISMPTSVVQVLIDGRFLKMPVNEYIKRKIKSKGVDRMFEEKYRANKKAAK